MNDTYPTASASGLGFRTAPVELLLADDDPGYRGYCREIIDDVNRLCTRDPRRMGLPTAAPWSLRCFPDGAPLLNHARGVVAQGRRIPLCCLDICMPTDGLWTAEQLRALDPQVAIIFMTASREIETAAIRTRIGDNVFLLAKPFAAGDFHVLAQALVAT